MRPMQTILSLTVVITMGCENSEESSSSIAQTMNTVEGPLESDTEQSYSPGDCCFAACVISLGGGIGFCEANLGSKVKFGECGERSKGYCQYKGKPFAYASWGKCSGRSGC